MDRKKIAKKLLYPHRVVLWMLVPVSAAATACSLMKQGRETAITIASYVLAFYTLVAVCLRVPRIIEWVQTFKHENKYMIRWNKDTKLRINVTLCGTLLWNFAYAVLQLVLGIVHASWWYGSMACYYSCLALMRIYLVHYTRHYAPGEHMHEELVKYRTCGIAFLVMNLVISLMIFFMVYRNRTFVHHEIITITMAAYTFLTMIRAVINLVKFKKYNSPVYTAARAVSLAAACVSMLTLESTMLTTFGANMPAQDRRLMLGCSGGAVSVFIIAMAIYMIVTATRKIKELQLKEE